MSITKTKPQAALLGAIMGWTTTSAPSNWLLCDGTSYSTTTYAGLFGVIGYTYGGSGANFNVPNIQGKMVAGFSTSTQLATTSVNSTSASNTSNTGNRSADHAHNATTGNVTADHLHQFFQGNTNTTSGWASANHYHGVNDAPADSPTHSHSMLSHTHATPDLVLVFIIKYQ